MIKKSTSLTDIIQIDIIWTDIKKSHFERNKRYEATQSIMLSASIDPFIPGLKKQSAQDTPQVFSSYLS